MLAFLAAGHTHHGATPTAPSLLPPAAQVHCTQRFKLVQNHPCALLMGTLGWTGVGGCVELGHGTQATVIY